jgi:hypothetical protein
MAPLSYKEVKKTSLLTVVLIKFTATASETDNMNNYNSY